MKKIENTQRRKLTPEIALKYAFFAGHDGTRFVDGEPINFSAGETGFGLYCDMLKRVLNIEEEHLSDPVKVAYYQAQIDNINERLSAYFNEKCLNKRGKVSYSVKDFAKFFEVGGEYQNKFNKQKGNLADYAGNGLEFLDFFLLLNGKRMLDFEGQRKSGSVKDVELENAEKLNLEQIRMRIGARFGNGMYEYEF